MSNTTVRALEKDDLEALLRIRRFAFLDDTDYDDREKRERFLDYMQHMSGCFADGELVAASAMLPFSMYLSGCSESVAGLASVVSAGAQRRRGYVRRLLRAMLTDLHRKGVGWCLEYPFDQRYYAKFGWQTISNGYFAKVPTTLLPDAGPVDGVRRIDPENSTDVAVLRRIYGQWARQFNFTMARDEAVRPDWDNLVADHRGTSEQRFVFALDDGAYCILSIRRDEEQNEIAKVLDWAYATPEHREKLLHYWATLRGQIECFEIQIPDGDPLLWKFSPHLVANPQPLQARIVDIPSALSGMRCAAEIDAVVRVHDEFCPWNDATFRIVTNGDELHVELTDDTPATELDIETLALLASGTPVDHLRAGLVDGDDAIASNLSSLSDRPAYMSLCDYF